MKLLSGMILLSAALSGCGGMAVDAPPRSGPLALDPVCGEVVDPPTPWRVVYREQVRYFHSDDCRRRFAGNPEYYAFGPYPRQGPRVHGNQVYYRDPVCGREVPPSRWWAEAGDRVSYFHDVDCLLEFRSRPEQQIEAR